MSHLFFFSYASENLDKELRGFFEDLCENVQPYTQWAAKDPRISFRDKDNIPLMDQWRPDLIEALQTSAVFVCVASPAYFSKPFCGKEYYIFDQRLRRHAAGGVLPGLVLPVLWAPTPHLDRRIESIQLKREGMSEIYWEKGLRYLKIIDPGAYEKCVLQFAEAIKDAWNKHGTIPRLTPEPDMDRTPNAFNIGEDDEALGPGGWIAGSDVANFIYAAGTHGELGEGRGRYGGAAREWRPFLPPEPRTVSDIARDAAHKNGLKYRAIPVNTQLQKEVRDSKDRKNLTVFLADPKTLSLPAYQGPVRDSDSETWTGSALLVLSHQADGPWDATKQQVISQSFPVLSQLDSTAYHAPIPTVEDLEAGLATTFAGLRGAITNRESQSRKKTDDAPAQVTAKPPEAERPNAGEGD